LIYAEILCITSIHKETEQYYFMHLRIEFQGNGDITLPLQYNHLLQGFIYKTIDEKMADFLHNRGYGEGRIFKLFTFSRLIGSFNNRLKPNHIVFKSNIFLELASPLEDFCESFANGLFKKSLNIGGNELNVVGITIERHEIQGEFATLESLSPIVVYSTMTKSDGSKYTCYFHPGEKEFEKIATENLRKKYQALTGKRIDDELTIRCESRPKLCVLDYKNTIIKGYMGKLSLNGPNPLIQIALDAGLGSKNSQGFGCMRLAEKKY